jgi:Na+/H+-dicarboxylate symporter
MCLFGNPSRASGGNFQPPHREPGGGPTTRKPPTAPATGPFACPFADSVARGIYSKSRGTTCPCQPHRTFGRWPRLRAAKRANRSRQNRSCERQLRGGHRQCCTATFRIAALPPPQVQHGDMLAVIFIALAIGVALTLLSAEKARPMQDFLESLGHITVAIIEMIMKVAPYGVSCLIFSVTARFGFGLLLNLLKYVVTVVGSLALFQFVGYALILKLVAGRSPREFFRKAKIVMLTAFSTSSSNATLPTTMRVAQEDMGIPREIAGFTLPLGATMNMNGTSLFEGATVLFLAQVFGVHLTIGQQFIVVIMSVVTAIGVAGIPGGSIPLLMMVLGMVGVPMEGIAIILGVDRILDMCRTTLNVTGDLVTATIVNRFEGTGPVMPAAAIVTS